MQTLVQRIGIMISNLHVKLILDCLLPCLETFLTRFLIFADVKVRWMDIETTQLALVRCSREWAGHVRAALTFWNSLPPSKQPPASSSSAAAQRVGDGSKRQRLVHNVVSNSRLLVTASVISVHGSARTAKLATMARVRSHFRQQLEQERRNDKQRQRQHLATDQKRATLETSPFANAATTAATTVCRKMETLLQEIDKIDAEQYYVKEEVVAETNVPSDEEE